MSLKIHYLLVLCLIFFYESGFSQSHFGLTRCATHQHHQKMQQQNPQEFPSDIAFERWMSKKLENYSQTRSSLPVVITLPVVVHVIHDGDAIGQNENISDAQVISQIDVLNEDFRRMTGTNGFNNHPDGADSEIEFCLAQIDPSGNPTNGINRVDLGQATWSMNSMESTGKPSTGWDPTQYFNIWVCALDGGLLGYAQFPSNSGLSGLNNNGGAANTDGVVIGYNYFGSIEKNDGSFNLSAPYNLGRTATHEVGHWLGLRHIWGDGNCNADDFCADTPESNASNYGCPTGHVSCQTVDMIENYMDYTDDACMNIFTNDQKARMLTVLANSPRRLELVNSSLCVNTPTPPTAAFSSDFTAGCPGLAVQFNDNSTGGATSWSWSFPGGTPSTSTDQNPLVTYNGVGTFDVTLTATNAEGSDTAIQTGYIVVSTSGVEVFFYEGFEGDLSNWLVENPDGNTTWAIYNVSGTNTGSKAAGMDNYNYNSPGERDAIVSSVIDLSGRTSLVLDFDHAHRRYSADYADSLVVYASTDGGLTFSDVLLAVAEDGSGTFATNAALQAAFTPSSQDDWCYAGTIGTACYSIDLTAYEGVSNFVLKFENVNDYGNFVYLDNIRISGTCAATATPPLADFTSSILSDNCGVMQVQFTDVSTGNPTSWSWSFPGGTPSTSTDQNPVVTYDVAGTYDVALVATNADGSSTEMKTNHVTLQSLHSLSTTNANTSCGLANGSATVNVSGGQSPFTYTWSNGATSPSANGLVAGDYTVTVSDVNNCDVTATVTIAASSGITATTSGNDTSCGQTNGMASASGSGGSQPYTYAWSNGVTTPNINNLASGTYSVTVTDANGCFATSSIIINDVGGVTVSVTGTGTSCGLANGTVSASVSGGTTPYTYAWSNGATTASQSNLGAGVYTVTVTDANNCQSVESYTVATSSGITATTSGNDTSCGQTNGMASASGSGGSQPYTYAWSNGATTPNINNLASGTYSVTVTDANGCFATSSIIINDVGGATVSVTGTGTSCGLANGTVSASVSGGTTPYAYAWSNGATTASQSNLGAGVYTVTVTDANNCQSVESYTVATSSGITATTSGNDTSCGQTNGMASASGAGGSQPYTYAWSNGSNLQTIEGLSSGIYTVTITDTNGCQVTDEINIMGSEEVLGTITTTNISCGESNDGSMNVNMTSGLSPFSYLWNTGETTSMLSNLSAGIYTVTVTDDNGCEQVLSGVVEDYNFTPTASASTNLIDLGTETGQVDFSDASEGAISWNWDFGDGNTSTLQNPSHTYSAVGVYTVLLNVSNGICSESITFVVTVDDSTPVAEIKEITAFDISPNPSTSFVNLHITSTVNLDLEIKIYDAIGQYIGGKSLYQMSGTSQTRIETHYFAQGVYFIEITNGNNKITKKFIKF